MEVPEDIRIRETFAVKDAITSHFDCTEIKPHKTKVRPQESLALTAKVKNVGLISDIAQVRLLVNGEQVACRPVDLSPNEERELKFKVKLRVRRKARIAVGLPRPKAEIAIQVQPTSKRRGTKP